MEQFEESAFAAHVAETPPQPEPGAPVGTSATEQVSLNTINAKLNLLLASQGIEYDESGKAKG